MVTEKVSGCAFREFGVFVAPFEALIPPRELHSPGEKITASSDDCKVFHAAKQAAVRIVTIAI